MLVVVTGLPGSGKTTLACHLSRELGLPLIAKDHYKEILFDALGAGDAAWSRRVGQAAIALQYDAMRTIGSAVVDSALWTGVSEPELEALPHPVLQVFCRCPFEVARDRFFARLRTGGRHPGYREEEMTEEDYERFRRLARPLRLRAPLLEVDTDAPVDAAATAASIRRLL